VQIKEAVFFQTYDIVKATFNNILVSNYMPPKYTVEREAKILFSVARARHSHLFYCLGQVKMG